MKATKQVKKAKKTAKPRRTRDGAELLHGKGIAGSTWERLAYESETVFDARKSLYLVVAHDALGGGTTQVYGFTDKTKAIQFARGQANGNVDHRVLTVTAQTFVLGTENHDHEDL